MTKHAQADDWTTIKAALLSEQARLLATQHDLDASELARRGAQDERTAMARDEADVAADDEQRSIDEALVQQVRAALGEVERALGEIASGSYGRCRDCGLPIDPARLAARPVVQRCLACQRKQESSRFGARHR